MVKPSYNLRHVERLYNQVLKNLSCNFKFYCLTDTNHNSIYPINFIDISSYQLDTWWNKVLIFDKTISGNNQNLYFDLDIDISDNIDFLIDDLDNNKLAVVDTIWKQQKYFDQLKKFKRASSFISYGNSSVMGWIGNSHQFLVDMLLEDLNKHTIEHFGDDTFINKYGNIKYFSQFIGWAGNLKYVDEKKILIGYKDL